MTTLHLPSAEVAADLATYLGRARRLDPDGAVRLATHDGGEGGALAVTVSPLALEGMVLLGLRLLPLARPTGGSGPAPLDVVVPLAALADRMPRLATTLELDAPPVEVAAPWAGISPPRSGWETLGLLDVEVLRRSARDGVVEVADGTPVAAGGHAVAALRARVWGRELVPGLRAGAAFVAEALGFLAAGGPASLSSQGSWRRLSTSHGHVLTRRRTL